MLIVVGQNWDYTVYSREKSLWSRHSLLGRGERMMVEICFFANGYRKEAPFGISYRPHFVVKGTTEYLGIQFVLLEKAPFDENVISEVEFLYEGVDYSGLNPGVCFEIREGAHTVGEGVVISI